MNKLTALIMATLLLISHASMANWQLDNAQSTLNFVSIKKQDIAESHTFKQLSGAINDSGAVNIEVDLASLDTNIEIRDTRMKEMLFNVADYPKASISAQLDQQLLAQLEVGDMLSLPLQVNVSMHGMSQVYDVQAMVVYANENQLLVSSLKPILLNVSSFGFDNGVAKLTEIAGLPSISKAVPVSFALTFSK